MAIKIVELELAEEIKPIWVDARYDRLRGLVRLRGEPIGWIDVKGWHQSFISAARLKEAVCEQLGWDLLPSALARSLAAPGPDLAPQPISVVVCTRDRADQLERCLRSLLALDYPAFEIIVVDNAPGNDETRTLAGQFPVRYVREERPGLDWARNRGIAEAHYDIIAYVDDDAHPDHNWLRAIHHGFANPEVMAVTGLVAPDELETTPQIRFELGYGGMGRGLRRWIARRQSLGDKNVLWASAFGVGTNMAFRRQLFQAIGGFDVALDVGTPSRGGGDNEMFYRVLVSGYSLLYEPAAIVWHTHRRDEAALHQTMYNNGCSVGAFLLTCWQNHSIRRRSVAIFFWCEWLAWWILRRLVRPGWFPRHLIWIELAGALASPFAYASARRQASRIAAAGPDGLGAAKSQGIGSALFARLGKLANAFLVLWGLA